MNYLELAVANHKNGVLGPVSHLASCIGREQNKIAKAVAKNSLWFVDIPRTSSSSIQFMLGEQFGYPFGKPWIPEKGDIEGLSSPLLPPHTLAYQAREVMGREHWDAAKTFSVVRDPYSWSVSLWGYTKTVANLGLKNDTFEMFLSSMQARLVGAKEQRQFYPSNFLQTDYLTDHRGELIVDTVLKFEKRDEINEYLRSIGVEQILEEKLVSSNSADYQMSDVERALVKKVFEKDFEFLGY